MQYVVYGDMLFVINFLLDLALLLCTAHFGGFAYRRSRLLVSALLGGVYGVGILYPSAEILYLLPCKIIFSFVMLRCAFGSVSLRRFLRQICYFYAISFAMAGAVLGCSALLQGTSWRGAVLMPINAGALIFAILTALILARWGVLYLKRNWQKESLSVKAEIHIGSKVLTIPVFLDTGNDLSDPLSGNLVMVAEYKALKPILPSGFCRIYERYADKDVVEMLERHSAAVAGFRLRLVPFSAIGTTSGMLVGITPDAVIFYGKEKTVVRDLVICLYQHQLCNMQGCKAIVNPIALTERSERGDRLWAAG